MILNLITALFVVAIGAVLLLCLALGLLSLSQYIESHADRARRMARRSLYALTLLQLLVVVDGVPVLPLVPSFASVPLHHHALADPHWPFSVPSSSSHLTSLASLILLPLASHVYLVRHHTLTTHAWHQHRYDTVHRPKLPGGRLDWDVPTKAPGMREMTNMQVLAVLATVWSVPMFRMLGRVAAAEWGSAGIVGHGGRRSAR